MQQILVGLSERIADPAEHRIHGAGRQTGLKELFHELDRVTARDAVAHRERRDRRLQPGPQMAGGDLSWKLARAARTAARAAHSLATVLEDPDRDRRKLFDLVARRLAHCNPLGLAEGVATLAAPGPVIDQIIHCPRRQQRPPVTLVAGLAARFAPRTILAVLRSSPRRI